MPTTDYIPDVAETLAQRGARYGAFPEHAKITQSLKREMQCSPNWWLMRDDQREALEMIAHKIGRILNGDPDYWDSWHDIVGYARLVAEKLTIGNCDMNVPETDFGDITQPVDLSDSTHA